MVAASDWSVRCPKCSEVVIVQPRGVVTYSDPKFACKSCGSKSKLYVERPSK